MKNSSINQLSSIILVHRIETIENDLLKKFAADNPDYIKSKRKFLFQSDKPHIPFTANIIVNMEEKLYTTINFKYEVE